MVLCGIILSAAAQDQSRAAGLGSTGTCLHDSSDIAAHGADTDPESFCGCRKGT